MTKDPSYEELGDVVLLSSGVSAGSLLHGGLDENLYKSTQDVHTFLPNQATSVYCTGKASKNCPRRR